MDSAGGHGFGLQEESTDEKGVVSAQVPPVMNCVTVELA